MVAGAPHLPSRASRSKDRCDQREIEMSDDASETLLTLTADIVTAHVSNNSVAIGDLAGLIAQVHTTLAGLGSPAAEPQPELKPAVSVRSSIKPDYIVCLEDGKKLKMLKRHLMTHYQMTPADYRAKWSLPADYPMVAPNYAAQRKELALKIGLGRKPKSAAAPAPAPKTRRARIKSNAGPAK
jgi:predicted transcriptional regulator